MIMRERWLVYASVLLLCTSVALAQPRRVIEDKPAEGTKQPLRKEKIEGKVKSVKDQTAIVRTRDGRDVKVNLGPQDYWQEKGYRLHEGDDITVQGWRPDGRGDDDWFFAGGIWGPGFYFELSNDDGYPYWCPRDDYWAGWYPTYEYYHRFYWGPPPWAWGPPRPHWGPPPPWHHRRDYAPPPPPDRHRRHRHGGHDRD
jgi:hypothetical protein